jgi:predicted small secreted protein
VRRQPIIIICIFVLGLVFPFIDYLVVVETFFLLIPLAILLFASVALLIGYLVWDRTKLKRSIYFILAVPIFIAAQFISTRTVDKVQRRRSEFIIKEIESITAQIGQIPDRYPLTYGIKFSKLEDKSEFKLVYSRGFMITENYDSKDKTWRSQGWND